VLIKIGGSVINNMQKVGIMIFLVLFVVTLAFLWLYWSCQKRFYDERPIEVHPDQVINKIEMKFKIKIPKSAVEIHAAESKLVDHSINFIIKFKLSRQDFKGFISTFSKGITLEPYHQTQDYRNTFLSPMPQWFLTPIIKGEIGSYGSAYGSFFILVDQADVAYYNVYIHGHY
jgi:hypothetical protein